MIDLTKPRDLGQILNTGYLLYRSHFAVFATIGLIVVVPLDLLSLGVIDGYLWSDYDRDGDLLRQVGIGYPIVLALVTTPLVTAGVVLSLAELGAGREPSVRASLEVAGQLLWVLIGTLVLVAGGVILGFIAFIVPGVYLVIRWVFAPQAVIAEKLGPTEAIRRSGELVAGSWWRVLGITVVVGFFVYSIGGILSIPFMLGAAAADVGALYVIGTVISDTISLPLGALGITLLYFDLRARKAGAQVPPA
jgi:hypothetical protein